MKTKIVLLTLLLTSFAYKSQVVINEVHLKPAGGDTDQAFQSMYNANATSGAEFIEIYNISSCPVDISCWTLGGMDGGTNGGAFSFPSGTIIPPLGFITIGGPLTIGVNFNLNLSTNSARLWRSNASRWHLPNGDGWVALYDASGSAMDAVYWTFDSNDPTKLNTDATFTTGALQRIGACGGGSLATASAISGIEYIVSATVTGQSYERTTDGSMSWALGAPTPNNCNGTCVVANGFQLNALVQQPSCGQSNGSISFSPTPQDTYFYNWPFPTTGNVSSVANLSAGDYFITITNISGCTKDTTITLVPTGGVTAVNVSSTNPSCSSADGTVSIGAVTGGTAPYQFNFNGTGYGTSLNFSNLTSGTYTLNVQDNTGCVYSAPSIVLTAANTPTAIAVSTTPENCNQSNGSVSLGAVTGGSAPYQFDFNGGGYSSNIAFTNLASGNYTLSVQDNSGCVYNAPVVVVAEIAGPSALVVTTNNATCGNANGSVVLGAVTGGTAPYQYNFNNSGYSNTTNYSNLNTGNYTISVQDNAGCIYTAANAVITNTASPTGITQTINDASCGLQNGSVVLGSVTGGTAPYQYNFNGQGFSSTTTFSGLNGGSYSLIVQDALGCTYAAPAIVLATSVGPTTINFNSVNASCDQDNGSIQIVSITGGTAPYQYSVNGSALTTSTNYPNLVPGAYELSVLDASGCTIQTQVQISGGSSPIADFAINPSAISIFEPYTNLINLSSSDVVLNSWVIPNGQPNSSNSEDLQVSFLDAESGTYPITLIVTNADGCTDTVVKTIEVFAEITVFAPNSFTPDNDEFNNDWRIYVSNADLATFKLQIYNRWGELVFESFDSEVGWDGTYNGVYVQDGTYSWTFTIKDLRNDNYYKYLGHINKIQ